MTSPTAYPEVPEFLLRPVAGADEPQSVDCGVPAALIMRVHPSQIEVLVSDGSDSPYHPGERENLCTGLYCEHVIATRDRLHVANALIDPNWDHNPDLRLGMISYLGYPLLWPDGVPSAPCASSTEPKTTTRKPSTSSSGWPAGSSRATSR
jgi:hypothetical protein